MLYALLTENDAHYRSSLHQYYADHHFHVRPGVWLVSSSDSLVAMRERLCPSLQGPSTDDGLVILTVAGWCGHQADHLREWLLTTAGPPPSGTKQGSRHERAGYPRPTNRARV